MRQNISDLHRSTWGEVAFERQSHNLTYVKIYTCKPGSIHSNSPDLNTACAHTQLCTVLIMVCQGSCETGRRANMLPNVITPGNRSSAHQSFNHLVLQWVRRQRKDNRLLSRTPLLSQIYDPLSNFSIYSAVWEEAGTANGEVSLADIVFIFT